jgi:hypothetical protein
MGCCTDIYSEVVEVCATYILRLLRYVLPHLIRYTYIYTEVAVVWAVVQTYIQITDWDGYQLHVLLYKHTTSVYMTYILRWLWYVLSDVQAMLWYGLLYRHICWDGCGMCWCTDIYAKVVVIWAVVQTYILRWLWYGLLYRRLYRVGCDIGCCTDVYTEVVLICVIVQTYILMCLLIICAALQTYIHYLLRWFWYVLFYRQTYWGGSDMYCRTDKYTVVGCGMCCV